MSTTKTALKRPEVLAPAGTLEKLKTAIHYGADAVYIGGNAYGLRSRAGNFTYEQMAEGVAYAREHDAKVYVAANMVTHAIKKVLASFSVTYEMLGFPQLSYLIRR